jgi:hypothetical protein
MDPVTAKNASSVLNTPGASDTAQSEKTNPSKFDKVREQAGGQENSNVTGPDANNAAPAPQQLLERQLRQKLDAHPSRKPTEVFGDDLRATGRSLNQLKDRVSGLAPSPALDQIRKRLVDLDTQFQKTGAAIEGIGGPASPKQLLKLQTDMYQISENLGVVSKMVDQVTSGVKTLLQTQV